MNLAAVLLIASLFIPGAAHLEIAGVRLEAYRIVLLIVFLANIQEVIAILIRWKIVMAFLAICFLSSFYHRGFSGIPTFGILTLEILGSLYIGYKVAFQSENGTRIVAKAFGLMFIIVAPFAVIEALNAQRIFHIFFGELFNTYYIADLGESYFRHGIHRASTVFSHPITYSVIAVSLLPLFVLKLRGLFRALAAAAVLAAAVTSVTSAGVLMLLVFIGALLVLPKLRAVEKLPRLMALSLAGYWVFMSYASDRGPIVFLMESFAFNPQTAWTRLLQWQHASDDILANPILGVGAGLNWSRPSWMPESIDSYWLVASLEYGIPAAVLLFSFFCILLLRCWKAFQATGDILFYWMFFSVFALIIAATTVDFFDRLPISNFLWFGLILGEWHVENGMIPTKCLRRVVYVRIQRKG